MSASHYPDFPLRFISPVFVRIRWRTAEALRVRKVACQELAEPASVAEKY
jgi:hypothetical protein